MTETPERNERETANVMKYDDRLADLPYTYYIMCTMYISHLQLAVVVYPVISIAALFLRPSIAV